MLYVFDCNQDVLGISIVINTHFVQDSAAKFKYQLHMAINDPSLPRPPAPFTRTRLPSAAPAAVRYISSNCLVYNKEYFDLLEHPRLFFNELTNSHLVFIPVYIVYKQFG